MVNAEDINPEIAWMNTDQGGKEKRKRWDF